MDKNAKLYFVALIPPEEVFQEVMALKHEVAERFKSRAALRSPPHITLHMPFQYREDREEHLFTFFSAIADQQKGPLPIRHQGFGCFEPRVIYVNVTKTEDLEALRQHLITQMRRVLKLENADYKNQGFHPHMTIAFRDLKKAAFHEAWNHFETQPFEKHWQCGSFFLLKHTGKVWDPYKEFVFKDSSP